MENIKELLKDIKTKFEIKKNEEQNGIELYFEGIPPYNERTILKSHNFKWHNAKKCWYKKIGNATEPKKETKKQNTIDLKSIRLATAEEIEMIVKEQWKDEKMQEFLKKSYDFYMLEDGLYIEIEKPSKISIDKTLWYDDNYEIPDATEENFLLYNEMNNPARTLENYLENVEALNNNGCATGLYDYKGLYLVCYYKNENRADVHCYYEKDEKTFKRYLSKDEQDDYIKILMNLKEKYIERLKKYYKKYGKHVHSCGYWADR